MLSLDKVKPDGQGGDVNQLVFGCFNRHNHASVKSVDEYGLFAVEVAEHNRIVNGVGGEVNLSARCFRNTLRLGASDLADVGKVVPVRFGVDGDFDDKGLIVFKIDAEPSFMKMVICVDCATRWNAIPKVREASSNPRWINCFILVLSWVFKKI